jgi:hypothetical protein
MGTWTGSNRALPWMLVAAWLVLPGILWWMAYVLDSLYPFLAHQLYYLPLGSWMGLPFFEPDAEVMFSVKPAGRWATATFYLALAAAITFGLDRFGKWRNTLWRQLAAFAAVLAVSHAAGNLFNIHGRSYAAFSYGRTDALADLCALWFALLGGWLSGRYRFAIAMMMLHLSYGLLGMYYVQNAFHVGWPEVVAANAINTAVSMGAVALGACVGVFIRQRRLPGA